MSREIRKVPLEWEHPKNEYNNFEGMFYAGDFDFWVESYQDSLNDYETDLEDYTASPEDWDYTPPEEPEYPNIEDFVPVGDYFQLYETTSEGTPISPKFKTLDELIDHLLNIGDDRGEKWSENGIQSLLNDELIPTLIIENGKSTKGFQK